MLLRSAWLACILPWSTHAIKSSEAGVVDWHKPLIGDVLTGNSELLPVFHRIQQNGHTRSLVLTATTNNVLAALHPENGTLAWRYLFDNDDRVLMFKKHKNVVVAVSGAGGATLRTFDVSSGHLLSEKRLHNAGAARLLEPDITGLSLAFDSAPSTLYVLTNGHIVRRVDADTGEIRWGWTASDQASLNIYASVVPTSSAVYVIGLAKNFASYTLHITALSPEDGTVIATADVPSSITDGPNSIFTLKRVVNGTERARAVWLDKGKIHSVGLTPDLQEKPTPIKGAAYERLVRTGLDDHGLFVAIKDDGSGRVIKMNDENTGLKVVWEFADSAQAAHYTDSIYSGGFDKLGYPYIARVFWSHVYKQALAHVYAPHLADGKGLITGYTFPFETSRHGIIGHIAVDAATVEDYRVLARLVVCTTTSSIQLWQQDQMQWNREEGLSELVVAEFVELPEQKMVAGMSEESETFAQRLRRQLLEARDFPHYAAHFAKRFVTGSYDSVNGPVVPLANSNDTNALSRDAFGFRQVIVAMSARGKVYGIDSSNGEVIWSRVLGFGWAAKVGAKIYPVKIFTTRTVSDGDTPQVVLVTQRKADNGLIDTVLFHVDALTGEDATYTSQPGDLLQGIDVVKGPLVDAFLVQDTSKYIVIFDEFLQASIYPDTPEHMRSFTKRLPSLHFALRTGEAGSTRLTGHRLPSEKEFTGKYVAFPSWTSSLPAGEDIEQIIRPPHEPISSLGKVLGNRTTLYKYLNPGLVVLITSNLNSAVPNCGVYAMDSAKGTILYHVVLPAANAACNIKATLAKNWLVYHYYDHEMGVDQAKGYRIVSVEFYEGSSPDEKTRSSDLSSYSNETTNVSVYEQTYIFPRAVSVLTTTTTKFGITSKDIIVASDNGIIQAFPRRFVDPRRPKRKPTTEEQEEWLVQYDPIVPDDPKRVLSHTYQVARVRNIITSPALLESTSLIFAYGLDLFATRIAPSNTFDVLSEDFNKAQLVLTVSGLALAIIITKPMVGRKKLREKWYN